MSDWKERKLNPLDIQVCIVIDEFGIVEHTGLEEYMYISYEMSTEKSKAYFYSFHIFTSQTAAPMTLDC